MRSLTLPVLLLLPLAAITVLMGGTTGAGVAALLGTFLVGFCVLLFWRESLGAHHRAGFVARRQTDAQFLGFVVLGGAFLRVFLALAFRQTGVNEVIAPDEYTFHDNGMYFLGWLRGEFAHPFSWKWKHTTDVGYFAVVGILYSFFGTYQVIPVLFNCFVGAACAVPAYRLGAHIGGRPAGRMAAILVTFFPSLILWSTLLIRDAAALFLILWCTCFAMDLMRRFSLRTLLLFLGCMALLSSLRLYLFLLIAAGSVVGFLVIGVRKPGRAMLTAVAAGLGALMLVKGFGLSTDYVSSASLEYIAARRHWNSFGEGGVSIGGFDLTTPMGALSYLPLGIMYFLFSPFPWQTGGRATMALPDVLLWYAAFPLVIYGILYGLRRRRRAALIPFMVAVLTTCLHALWEGNVGIIFRHRAHVLVLLLPFAAVGFMRLRARARATREALVRERTHVRSLAFRG